MTGVLLQKHVLLSLCGIMQQNILWIVTSPAGSYAGHSNGLQHWSRPYSHRKASLRHRLQHHITHRLTCMCHICPFSHFRSRHYTPAVGSSPETAAIRRHIHDKRSSTGSSDLDDPLSHLSPVRFVRRARTQHPWIALQSAVAVVQVHACTELQERLHDTGIGSTLQSRSELVVF